MNSQQIVDLGLVGAQVEQLVEAQCAVSALNVAKHHIPVSLSNKGVALGTQRRGGMRYGCGVYVCRLVCLTC